MSNLEHGEISRTLNRDSTGIGRSEILIALIAGIAFTAVWAIAVGKDVGWDQRNYHYYSVYSWLNGRTIFDIGAAGIQSWFNPLVYVPHFWLIRHVRPVIAGGLIGASSGLNFVLIYVLARLVIPLGASWWRWATAFLCAAVGFGDPFFLEFIGTTDVDNSVSVLVLASLCLLCWASRPGVAGKVQNRSYAIAGLLLGAAAGLKWTFFVYATAMGLTLLLLWSLLRMNLRRYLGFAFGGLGGFAITGGFWSAHLWAQYRNPFFPNWNWYFHSPWALPSNFRDMRFPPRSTAAAINLPFQWLIGIAPSSEDPFRDARFALLCVLICVIAAGLIGQRIARRWDRSDAAPKPSPLAAPQHWWLLLTFAVLSYILWLELFAIQRYLIPLGLIDGILLWLALDWLISSRSGKISAFLLLALFCLFWTRATLNGDRLPYGDDWYGVQLAPEIQEPGTLFIMAGGGPMGYIVPFLPRSSRTVRLNSVTMPDSETELVRHARDVILQHSGPIRSLAIMPLEKGDRALLQRFGLALDEGACVQSHSYIDQITSCRMTREAAPDSRGKP